MPAYRLQRQLSSPAHLYELWAAADERGQPVAFKRLGGWSQEQRFVDRLGPALAAWSAGTEGSTLVLDRGRADGVCLVEAWSEAESTRTVLAALANRRERPQLPHVVALALRASEALAALHARSTPAIHGDVCASTLLLDVQGRLLFTDVGIAAAAGSMGDKGPARVEAFTLAPEVAAGGSASAPADVFGLGLLLYELIMGHALFTTRDWAQAAGEARRFAGLPPDPFPKVPEPFQSVLRRALSLEPQERPPAREVAHSVSQLAGKLGNLDQALTDLFTRAFPVRPRFTPTPGQGTLVELQPLVASQTKVARIATRKMTVEELERARAAEAEQKRQVQERGLSVDERVLALLQRRGAVPEEGVAQTKAYAKDVGISIVEAVWALGYTDEETAAGAEAEVAQLRYVSGEHLDGIPFTPELKALLPEAEAEAHCAIAVGFDGDRPVFALTAPRDELKQRALLRACGRPAAVFARSTETAIQRAIGRLYRGEAESAMPSWLETSGGGAPAEDAQPIRSSPSAFERRALELHFDTPAPMSASQLFDETLDKVPVRSPGKSPPRRGPKPAGAIPPMEHELLAAPPAPRGVLGPGAQAAPSPQSAPTAPGAPPPPPKPPVDAPAGSAAHGLSAPALAVAQLLLSGRGPTGSEAMDMVALVSAVAAHLSLPSAEQDALRLAAFTVATHNVLESKRACEPIPPQALERRAGAAWPSIEPVVAPWLGGAPATSRAAQVLQVVWGLSAALGGVRVDPRDYRFQQLRPRLGGAADVVASLERMLLRAANPPISK